jgi:hypothetical protein
LPPPATPELADALSVGAGEGSCAVWGGSGRLSTRLIGAAAPGWIDPVASGLLLLENGLSSKRVSPLQAATLIAVSANASARGNGERNHRTIQAIATHTHAQYKALS